MTHPLFICESIAERLQDPKNVQKIAETSMSRIEGPSSQWQSYSFAHGFAGIAFFYSAMDKAYPGNNWGKIAQKYILEALDHFKEHKSVNGSLFGGLAGISLGMSSIQNGSDHFHKFHEGIDDWLIEDVTRSILSIIPRFLSRDTLIPPFFYGYASGLSGIISYLLTRKDHPYLQQLAKTCVNDLAKLMLTKKIVGQSEVEAWYYTNDLLAPIYHTPDFERGYNSSMAYGVTGCLTALSSAATEGIRSDSIFRAIEHIAFWLKETYQYVFGNCYWNSIISTERKIDALPAHHEGFQNTWILGWPSVAKSLFLASKALKNEVLFQFSQDLCAKFIEKEPVFFLGGSSFYFGIAGFISTLYPIAKETNNQPLLQTIRKLTTHCSRLFDPNVAFCFPQFNINADAAPFPVDCPTLLGGAAGIGLSLLVAEDKHDPLVIT